ncbi:MAG: tetratricopeptide repeat protein [Rhodocyclaceae bacterium]|nr:tetratricopeptide repeat protein [Rhodocyclaceae bacterium]
MSLSVANTLEQANQLLMAGQRASAAGLYRQALAAEPGNADALHGLGIVAWQEGRLDEARSCLNQAVALRLDNAGYWSILGDIERMAGDFAAAENCLRRALALQPDSSQALNNMGMVYLAQGRHTEAATLFMGAVQSDPDLAMAHYNLGIALRELNYLDDAIAAYRQAIALNPDFVEAHVNLAIALLLDGQLEEGFEEYEWRLKPPFASLPSPVAPLWGGLIDPDGTLLLYTEQGFGDIIQFIRYIPFIAREGMRVVVRCPAALENLLQGVEGVASTSRDDEALPPHTAQLPLLSLPRLFETRIDRVPGNLPCIQVPFGRSRVWRERLAGMGETIKVGLRWAGNPANTEDRRRSIPLSCFAGLAGTEQVTFISLDNVPVREADVDAARRIGLMDLSPELTGFVETAALIANLDLVIAVDTAVLHLAGALGRPAWALLRHSPHWPWLLDRDDSPWYPSLRLFRQERAGDWQPVVDRVVATLRGAMCEAIQES